MRHPKPLPPELRGRIFTRRQAVALGVTDRRLVARDIRKVARATYHHQESPQVLHSGQREPEPWLERPDFTDHNLLQALCARTDRARVSHVTAAQFYGFSLPRRFAQHAFLHLTGTSKTHHGVRDPQVVIHRQQGAQGRAHQVYGVPMSTPPEVFVEMAHYLSINELVVLGDQLVRIPRQGLEDQPRPWCTPEQLRDAVIAGKGRYRIGRARAALEQVRIGADSAPETLMRLALIAASLPEPELQIRLHPGDQTSPTGDAGYRRLKIVLQYEGEHHFTPGQQARDQRRNAAFEHAGWRVILVNRVDLQEGFRSLIARLRGLLRS